MKSLHSYGNDFRIGMHRRQMENKPLLPEFIDISLTTSMPQFEKEGHFLLRLDRPDVDRTLYRGGIEWHSGGKSDYRPRYFWFDPCRRLSSFFLSLSKKMYPCSFYRPEWKWAQLSLRRYSAKDQHPTERVLDKIGHYRNRVKLWLCQPIGLKGLHLYRLNKRGVKVLI